MRPGILKSKNPRWMPKSSATPATNRLVEEPISVTIPPKMPMKERGISPLAGSKFFCLAMAVTMGINITTTGVLFRKAEITPAATSRIRRLRVRPAPPILASIRDGASSASVLNIACPTISSDNTVIKAGLAKPATSSMPVTRGFPSTGNKMKSNK